MALQVLHFHRKMKHEGFSFEVTFETPRILETDKDWSTKRPPKKQKRGSFESTSQSISGLQNTKQTKTINSGAQVFSRHDHSSGRIVDGQNRSRRIFVFGKRPKYLEDLTREEKYLNFNSSTVPIVARLKARYPSMPFMVIPTDRWARLNNTTCIPSNHSFEESDYRAPYALILGAQKAGSSALAKYLMEHSQIVPTRKEFHFLSERMDFYNNDFEGIDQAQARSHYMRHILNSAIEEGIEDLRSNPQMHVIDATPTYLPKSDRVPYRALCLCPWARLIVLLREPISRVYSQFNMDTVHVETQLKDASQKAMFKLRLGSFDEFIQRDYDMLLELGVLLPENATDSEREAHYGSAKEREAWEVYTKLGIQMPIGRSLYAIQLRHWIDAYKERNQPLRMMVINSDDMKSETNATYRKVLDFLDLPRELPENFTEFHKHSYTRVEPISNSTRAMLERIFEPYNRQLGALIGPEWQGIWPYAEPTKSKER